MEGAGVRLHRVFGNLEVPRLDPFLLLDDFGSDNPDDYIAGFPWHPHRGIETVTYMLSGKVEHQDSLGNKGVIGPGDVQWMTAGSGIIHQEMPERADGPLRGFQLWVNLPAAHKMITPKYRGITANEIPITTPGDGVTVGVIAGEYNGTPGPVQDVVADPEYFDVSLRPGLEFVRATHPGHRVFAYVVEGSALFEPAGRAPIGAGNAVVYEDGQSVSITAGDEGVRFLFLSGKPIGEPVSWYGPIVMNTEQEIRQAFEEYENGTFIK
jgi:redox-sensitive bicupin YhaK (pirin superfamily)